VTQLDYFEAVRAQPRLLAAAAPAVVAALPEVVPALSGVSVTAFGMGASTHAAAGFAAALRAAGRSAVAASAPEVPAGPGGYLAVSHSGRSAETVEAAGRLPRGRRVGLLGAEAPDRPLRTVVDVVLPTGCPVDSRVSTASYTATLQALALLAGALTGAAAGGAGDPATATELPGRAEQALTLDVSQAVDALAGVRAVDVVGSGVRVASAGAAALLLREAARIPSTAMITREYLHGPLEVAGPGLGALVFGGDGSAEVRLAGTLAGYGAAVVLVTDGSSAPDGVIVLRVPSLPGLFGAVLEILPVHLLAGGLAAGREIELRHMPADTKLPALDLG
jgi:glutamine---fructose-6-phosphate transaminase (isomerizing)